MYRVLLIDDEALVHHYLRTAITWEKHGLTICGEAFNATAALELMAQERPDIVFLDVNMPGMNGVDLCKGIRIEYPEAQVIMLSSYDKYEFVRETLKNGAVDYLLKHQVDEAGLLAVLGKAKQELEKAALIRREKKLQDQTWRLLSPVVSQEYLREMIIGNSETRAEAQDYISTHHLFSGASGFAVVVLQITNFLLITENDTDAQVAKFVRTFQDLCQQSLGDPKQRVMVYMQEGRFAIIFSFQERSEHASIGELIRYLDRIEKTISVYMNLKCIFAASPICQLLTEIGRAYEAAERKLNQQIAGRSREEEAGIAIETDEVLTLGINDEKELLLAIDRVDASSVQSLIGNLFLSLRRRHFHPNSVQTIVSELIQLADKAWRKTGMKGPIPGVQHLSRDKLIRYESLEEIEGWIQMRYDHLLKALNENRFSDSYSKHVKLAMRFVRERYRENISLEQAAEYVGITSSYLSRLFKEETKLTFTEFLNRVRIDISKQLIENGNLTVKQICEHVGFASYNYFFKVFKELEGVTPQAFAKSKGNE
jgi:two-component system, response regulator YesN